MLIEPLKCLEWCKYNKEHQRNKRHCLSPEGACHLVEESRPTGVKPLAHNSRQWLTEGRNCSHTVPGDVKEMSKGGGRDEQGES